MTAENNTVTPVDDPEVDTDFIEWLADRAEELEAEEERAAIAAEFAAFVDALVDRYGSLPVPLLLQVEELTRRLRRWRIRG